MKSKELVENIDELFSRNRTRRDFIAKTMLSGAGGLLTGLSLPGKADAVNKLPGDADVSFIHGNDRRQNIIDVMKPFEKDIRDGAIGRQILVKCNLVGPNPLCAPHVDAVRGVLDFLGTITDQKIIVGDSTGRIYPGPMGTWKHFELHNYLTLPKEYNMRLLDLNDEPTVQRWIIDGNSHPLPVNIIADLTDPKYYIISLTRFKTHGRGVVATLGVKNIIMGSPVNHYKQASADGRNEKTLMHSGPLENLAFNMFLIAQHVRCDLSVLDGFEGMEGNGPTEGTGVDHRVAVAGKDWIAVDRIGLELMGIDFNDIPYLPFCAQANLGQSDRMKIKIIGENPLKYVKKYRMNDNILNPDKK